MEWLNNKIKHGTALEFYMIISALVAIGISPLVVLYFIIPEVWI